MRKKPLGDYGFGLQQLENRCEPGGSVRFAAASACIQVNSLSLNSGGQGAIPGSSYVGESGTGKGRENRFDRDANRGYCEVKF
jgi:hypothetical protein